METRALVCEFANAIERKIDDLLSNGVVAAGIVVCRVLFAVDELLRMEKMAVRAGAHLVHARGLEIDENGAGNVLARACLGEEGVEGVVANANGLVGWHLAVRLDAVLETVEFPAAVADLDPALANVDRYNFAHFEK